MINDVVKKNQGGKHIFVKPGEYCIFNKDRGKT